MPHSSASFRAAASGPSVPGMGTFSAWTTTTSERISPEATHASIPWIVTTELGRASAHAMSLAKSSAKTPHQRDAPPATATRFSDIFIGAAKVSLVVEEGASASGPSSWKAQHVSTSTVSEGT